MRLEGGILPSRLFVGANAGAFGGKDLSWGKTGHGLSLNGMKQRRAKRLATLIHKQQLPASKARPCIYNDYNHLPKFYDGIWLAQK